MVIEQKDKESIAAYIHRFKKEAKRCNFTNNTATIRILVKGLKNAHTLAAHVYEKGPQTLTDAISEVEKLQAAQQLAVCVVNCNAIWFIVIKFLTYCPPEKESIIWRTSNFAHRQRPIQRLYVKLPNEKIFCSEMNRNPGHGNYHH